MKVCVVALGKIGLPLAVQIAMKGHEVIGADVNPDVVEMINSAVATFPGEVGLQDALEQVVGSGRLRATTATSEAVSLSDSVLVVVPLIVDSEARPDFRALDAANRDIAAGLRPGAMVTYETTVPVGTTRARFTPALAKGSGLTPEEDLFVVYSPERVYSGRIFEDLRKYPKLLGGLGPRSTARGVAFYEAVLDFDERPDLSKPNGVWDLGSLEASEFAKVAETTYRDVNIGLANQFAKFADTVDIDVYKVIEASNSQPFSHIHQPGIAVGGHCIPVYPRFYLVNDPSAEIVRSARAVNDSMPAYAVAKLQDMCGGTLVGRRVAVLGAAYRGGVKETAFSGVFAVVAALIEAGASPLVHDPLYTDEELMEYGFTPFRLGDHCEAVVIQSDHVEYRALSPGDVPGAVAVLDGRRVTGIDQWPEIAYDTIGAPTPGPQPTIGSS